MEISYGRYLDKVYGGWLGKCIGGTIGARFEGQKHWIELDPDALFPEVIPPNDDLDIPVLWLKVLEEKGAHVSSEDLAEAWLEHCWYPFNEYGIFRRNWQLGIHPPFSGSFGNQFWETGMGCTVRSEIWGYVFPGAPDVAARYVDLDGSLEHTAQGIQSQKMLMAMASMAFFINDVHRLTRIALQYAPPEGPLLRAIRAAFECHERGVDFRVARERTMLLGGHTETSDTFPNMPTIFLALLYGEGDLEKTMLLALRCAYDTDTTLAMTGALLGQILGASGIPPHLKNPVGDELVMGISYQREEMTLSALARDTVRMGVLLNRQLNTGVCITGAPDLEPLPRYQPPPVRLHVTYDGMPAAAPGDTVHVRVEARGALEGQRELHLEAPPGWQVAPSSAVVSPLRPAAEFALHARGDGVSWPIRNIFRVWLAGEPAAEETFGVAGAALWRMLGVFFDTKPYGGEEVSFQRLVNHHFVSLEKEYLPEDTLDTEGAFKCFSEILGAEAIVRSYDHNIDPGQLIGLQGAYCTYLARTVISPEVREVHVVIGNTDPFRLFVNGEQIGESGERIMWTPFNHSYRVPFREGANTIVVKLITCGQGFHFTLGLRPAKTDLELQSMNCTDWNVDMADAL